MPTRPNIGDGQLQAVTSIEAERERDLQSGFHEDHTEADNMPPHTPDHSSDQRNRLKRVARFKRVAHHSALASAVCMLLCNLSSIADDAYPSSLQDYVTIYEVNSYHQFQQDNREYTQRLELGKQTLRQMRKSIEDRKVSGLAARQKIVDDAERVALDWFKSAASSSSPASELPGIPNFDNPGVANGSTLTAESPIQNATLPDANNVVEQEKQAGNTAANLAASVKDIVANTATANLGNSGTLSPTEDSEPNADRDSTGSRKSTGWLGGLFSRKGNRDTTPLMADDDQRPDVDSIPDSELNALSEPFPETQLDASYADMAFSGDSKVQLEAALKTSLINSTELNARIDGFNAALEGVESGIEPAINGDGSQFEPLVYRIEALVDSRRSTQAMIDQFDVSKRSSLHAYGDLQSICRKLHDGIFRFPKSNNSLRFTKSVGLLKRLKEAEAALNQLSHGTVSPL